jgi:hypothetical protein
MTLDQMLELGEIQAREILIGKPKASLSRCFLIESPMETMMVITPWNGDEERESALTLLRFIMKEQKATAYSVVTEAWVSMENVKKPTGLKPSDREDKKEVVIVMAIDKLNKKLAEFDIVRDNQGTVTDLTKSSDHKKIIFVDDITTLLED